MKLFSKIPFLALPLLLAAPFQAAAQQQQIEIVFDASNSMNELLGQNTRLDEAKKALTTVAAQIAPGANVGLRIFGQKSVRGNVRESCFDSQLVIPIQPYQKQALLDQVTGLAAHGQTALGYSLELAAKDFSADAKKSIILISDGEESCGKDPVNVVKNLQAQGIEMKVHAIGFAVDPKTKAQLQQITQLTGGTYQDAQNAGQLAQSLQTVAKEEKIMDKAAAAAVPETPQEPEGKLLKAGRAGSGENLLAASGGTKIVSATNEDMAETIDGVEDLSTYLSKGDTAVFSFKDNQVLLLETFALPISEENGQNPGELYLSGSLDNPNMGFVPILTVKPKNAVDFKNIYQEFKIEPPVPVRYLRVQVGPSMDGGGSSLNNEWKIYGKFLSEPELAEALKNQKAVEQNVIGKENGGQLIASSDPSFAAFNDGTGEETGEAASVEGGQEAIFGFRDGKSALLTKASVPIFESSQYNCRTFEISTTEGEPSGDFTPAGTFETKNMAFAGQPYQDFKFAAPVSAKYVKVKILNGHEDESCELPEVKVYGTLQ